MVSSLGNLKPVFELKNGGRGFIDELEEVAKKTKSLAVIDIGGWEVCESFCMTGSRNLDECRGASNRSTC